MACLSVICKVRREHSLEVHSFFIYDERDGPKIFHTQWADGMVVSGWVLATVGLAWMKGEKDGHFCGIDLV